MSQNKVLLHLKQVQKQLLFFVLLFFSINLSYSQTKIIDSLSTQLKALKANFNYSRQDTTLINLLNTLGREFYEYEIDSAFFYSKKALELSKNVAYTKGSIAALNNLANYYSDIGAHDKSILCFNQILPMAKEIQNDQQLIDTKISLAKAYNIKENYELALQESLEGIEIAKKIKNSRSLALFYFRLSKIYSDLGLFKEAIIYENKVISIYSKLNLQKKCGQEYIVISRYYAEIMNLKDAKTYLNKGINIVSKNKDWAWLSIGYRIKGEIYLKEKNYEEALQWLKKSESILQQIDDQKIEDIYLLHDLAEAYRGINLDSISEQYANQSLSKAKFGNKTDLIKNNFKTLYHLYKKKDDPVKALKYFELHEELSDSLKKLSKNRNLLTLKAQMDHENQKELLIAENKKAIHEQNQLFYTIIAIISILLLLTILVILNERTQKKLNQELQIRQNNLEQKKIKLLEINTAKDKLFSLISKNLKGPIESLKNILQLFDKGEIDSDEFLNYVPKIRRDIDHLFFNLNNILAWGRTQMKGMYAVPSKYALEDLVFENMSIISEFAETKNIKIINLLPENTLTWSDPDQINIVLRNLIHNAIKFTPQKGIITISAQDFDGLWQITVTDTGVGMDQKTRAPLFKGGYNTSKDGTNKEKGTGIGLSICKELIAYNRGEIWVESSFGKGSSFHFTLPKFVSKNEKNLNIQAYKPPALKALMQD